MSQVICKCQNCHCGQPCRLPLAESSQRIGYCRVCFQARHWARQYAAEVQAYWIAINHII